MPDVLICNSGKIIGIVEMKYLPRAGARTEKDLKTLTWCVTHANRIGVRNDRYLGPGKNLKHYSLASDAVLCWAGVHRSGDTDLRKRVSKKLSPYFMELHAVTAKNEQPACYSNFRPRK
jgi:hypothetical protein